MKYRGHFPNFPYRPLQLCDRRELTEKHQSLPPSHFVFLKSSMAEMTASGVWFSTVPKDGYHLRLPFFERVGEVWVLINHWFKQHDCWQHTTPLSLTGLIKLTVAIKHMPPKYVCNDTWSPAGHLCRKLYSKILLKPACALRHSTKKKAVSDWNQNFLTLTTRPPLHSMFVHSTTVMPVTVLTKLLTRVYP